MRKVARFRRLVLVLAALALFGAACAAGYDSPSKIDSLRVLSVTVDHPYAQPGDEVVLRMTVTDRAGDPDDPDRAPRDLQILWLGGCFNPPSDSYYLCFEQLAETFQQLASGTPPPAGLLKLTTASADQDGEPDTHEFRLTLPADLLSSRSVPASGPHYGVAFVFFAVCAGQLAPPDEPLEAWTQGSGIDFPLQCLDADGHKLGADSFVPGYTQVFAFGDGRPNANPPIAGMVFDGEWWSEEPADAPVVPPCGLNERDREARGCVREGLDACQSYVVDALIADVAEPDPEATDIDGAQLREIVWVDYFVDQGDLGAELTLVSEARAGYQYDHSTQWWPPAEPGLVTLWAVARDSRGGSSVTRRFVRVQ